MRLQRHTFGATALASAAGLSECAPAEGVLLAAVAVA